MRRLLSAVAAICVVSAVAGCSQVEAIAPVGGDRLAEVRYAGIDVLVEEGVPILTAPVCTEATDATVTCVGETVDGDAIEVTSAGTSAGDVTVTVGGSTLYEGSLQSVLEKAMRP